MSDLKSLLAASALAGEQIAEDGKKVKKHEHKDGDHKDHGKHEGHKVWRWSRSRQGKSWQT